jgi:hypothetical protein|tara:strand:- start:321 stop:467 length:147 start_codon:yes stop_codon:yes gene_type:complete
MSKLSDGEREVLEFIVEKFSDYSKKQNLNETVDEWIADAKLKLEEEDA